MEKKKRLEKIIQTKSGVAMVAEGSEVYETENQKRITLKVVVFAVGGQSGIELSKSACVVGVLVSAVRNS